MSRHPTLNNIRFSRWQSFDDLFENPHKYSFPGCYLVAFFDKNPPPKANQTEPNIIYIGMSNKTVLSRLKNIPSSLKLKNSLKGKRLVQLPDLKRVLVKSDLYFSVYMANMDFPKKGDDLSAKQIRELGRIQYIEKNALARYKRKHGRIPLLNKNIRG